jgi:hypothetical protein
MTGGQVLPGSAVAAGTPAWNGIEVRNDAIHLLDASGGAQEVSPLALAQILGLPESAAADRAGLVRAAAQALPIAWRADGDEIVATLLGGGEQRFPADGIRSAMGAFDTAQAVASLNRSCTAGSLQGDGITVGKLAGKLLKGLAGKLGEFVGGLIIDELFPQYSMQSYFDEIYSKIAQMVKQEIAASKISTINGRIDGTQAFIRNEYKYLREDPETSREYLTARITSYSDTIYREVTYALTQDDVRKPGLSVFLLGAGVHLALMQELAMVDPKHTDPQKSPQASAVKSQAAEYLSIAQAAWQDVLSKRLSYFRTDVQIITMPPKGQKLFVSGTIYDDFTGSVVFQTASAAVWGAMADRMLADGKAAAQDELSRELAGDEGIDAYFAYLKSLTTNPIPVG